MTKEQFDLLVQKNKEEVDLAIQQFEIHSEKFNKKIKKILSVL